jgi:hypothetical protein
MEIKDSGAIALLPSIFTLAKTGQGNYNVTYTQGVLAQLVRALR